MEKYIPKYGKLGKVVYFTVEKENNCDMWRWWAYTADDKKAFGGNAYITRLDALSALFLEYRVEKEKKVVLP